MGDLKREIKRSYDHGRQTMGLKPPGSGARLRKQIRKQTDPLDDDQIAAINEQMGLGSSVTRSGRRRGRVNTFNTVRNALLGGGG